MKQGHFAILVTSVCIALCGTAAYAKSNPELVKQEAGYFYGYAKGDTAEFMLVYNGSTYYAYELGRRY